VIETQDLLGKRPASEKGLLKKGGVGVDGSSQIATNQVPYLYWYTTFPSIGDKREERKLLHITAQKGLQLRHKNRFSWRKWKIGGNLTNQKGNLYIYQGTR